jgi:hypothetical protein
MTLKDILEYLVLNLKRGGQPPLLLDDGATDWYPETLLDERESTDAGREDLAQPAAWIRHDICGLNGGGYANRTLYRSLPAQIEPDGTWVRIRY